MFRTLRLSVCIIGLLASGLVQGVAQGAYHPMIKETSPYSVHKTMDRLVSELHRRHIRVFARIDYQANARQIGVTLRPDTLLVFGKVPHTTQLIKEEPRFGVYLPMRVLAWQDASGQVWIGYNDITEAAPRYGLSADDPMVQVMSQGLELLCDIATGRE